MAQLEADLASPAWTSPAWAPSGQDVLAVIERAVETACAVLAECAPERSTQGLVSVRLSDDEDIALLNGQFRGKPKPTNVLAFPAAPEAMAHGLLGDVVLAFETVEREAGAQGKPLADHVSHLVIHGFLHLLGYDHDTAAEAAEMEGLETRILARLGIPDPYRAETCLAAQGDI